MVLLGPLVVLLMLAAAGPGRAADPASSGSATAPTPLPNLTSATPVDEGLRAKYGTCDHDNTFADLQLPFTDQNGNKWFGCSSDPSRLEKLVRLPATGDAHEAIVFTSKLAVDMDGSAIGCLHHGTDQCGTALMLPATQAHPCVVKSDDGRTQCVPVDADRIAYVVLPFSGPRNTPSTEFRDKTGIRVGDYGVVLRQGFPPVPVIVADTGPYYKIGEGSLALHRALGHDFCTARDAAGNCTSAPNQTSIASGVTTIIFPGSRHVGALTPDTIAATVQQNGTDLYSQLLRAYPPRPL